MRAYERRKCSNILFLKKWKSFNIFCWEWKNCLSSVPLQSNFSIWAHADERWERILHVYSKQKRTCFFSLFFLELTNEWELEILIDNQILIRRNSKMLLLNHSSFSILLLPHSTYLCIFPNTLNFVQKIVDSRKDSNITTSCDALTFDQTYFSSNSTASWVGETSCLRRKAL